MTPDSDRLQQRLQGLRRARTATATAPHSSDPDPDIRQAIAAIAAAGRACDPPRPVWREIGPLDPASLARRLATGLGADAIETEHGWYVRRELRPVYLPLDRYRLAQLPGMPDPSAPLLCLDTETTGLGSAAGTVAFLAGLGRWQDDTLRLVQLLLPDHSEEAALLDALAREIPPDAWLVTYNGRGFDMPLLETRYRMNRRPPPPTQGHLDLLPLVRQLFRHRLPDARLQTVERHLLCRHRPPDVPAWEIPSLYQAFLRGGPTGPLSFVARHNAEDVVTLGRLLAHLERGYGAGQVRAWAPAGDLIRLARLFRRAGRFEDALSCLETASQSPDIGGLEPAMATIELARLLRRVGRQSEAALAWSRLAVAPGPFAAMGWIELAKQREHHYRDLAGAWAATDKALLALYRSRHRGAPALRRSLEADLSHRRARLARRLARR
jgi:hypothetical protein